MRKTKIMNSLSLTLSLLFVFLFTQVSGQNGIQEMVNQKMSAIEQTDIYTPFEPIVDLRSDLPDIPEEVLSKKQLFEINTLLIESIQDRSDEYLRMTLPIDGQDTELQLVEAEIFTADFRMVVASKPDADLNIDKGLHYWGTIKGAEKSLVAISFFEDEVVASISLNNDQFVLGKIENSDYHILYNNNDLNYTPDFACGTLPVPEGNIEIKEDEIVEKSSAERCIRVHIEADYTLYQQRGGTSGTTNYVNGVFAEVATLYANENMNVQMSYLRIWDTPSPYSGSVSDMLGQLRARGYGSTYGDFVHLIRQGGGGGIAYVNAYCGSANVAVSGVTGNYSSVPTYTWDVEVITHELGHNFGSPHTHNCSWNGNNTAIDGCGPEAGYSEGCNAALPSNGGTIMSYCHLVSGVGINFNNGFGPQPGNRIRSRYNSASCLQQCDDGGGGGGSECATDADMTLTINLDNYPTETTWAVTNGGTTVVSGGNYNTANTTVTESMNLPDGDYTFTIYDSYGDGICCGYGNGSYTLSGGGTTVASGGNFNSSESMGFCVESGGDTQAPSAPLNLTASGTTETTTNLSWNASTDNVGVTAYNIYYQGNVISNTSSTSSNITGMSAGNSYTFHVTALDAAGNESGASNTVTVNTSGGGGDTQAPTRPLNLTASGTSETTTNLLWSASTDNVGVTAYNIYYGGSVIGSVNGTSANITGMSSGNSYSFYVTALDAAGNESGASNTVTVTTTGGSNCAGGAMTLTLTLDNYPTETSWTITRGGAIVVSGSGYSTVGATSTRNIDLTSGDYTFTIYDSYGDGICCSYGSGSYALRSAGTVIASGGNFTSSEATGFCVQDVGNIATLEGGTTPELGEIISLYPNPANNFINITGLSDKVQGMAIYSISGALIREIPSPVTTKSIDIATLQSGMYFLSIQTENGGYTTKKFIKQ